MKGEAFERWMAFLLMRNSHQAKHGTLMTGLIAQFSMGHDQCPKMITAACDMLNHHKWDEKPKPKQLNSPVHHAHQVVMMTPCPQFQRAARQALLRQRTSLSSVAVAATKEGGFLHVFCISVDGRSPKSDEFFDELSQTQEPASAQPE